MQKLNIVLLPGDGIGPEVLESAVAVLDAAGEKYGLEIRYQTALIGGCAIDETGVPLPKATLEICRGSDAVLLGAVGGPKWETLPGNLRPEAGLLEIRGELGLFANLRPAVIYPALKDASPLKDSVLGEALDILIVRELTGGIYFGKRGREITDGVRSAYDTERYSEKEIERIAHIAFQSAARRNKKLVSVDKANVLESSRLWREAVTSLAPQYPDVELSHMYVDNAAMQLVCNPGQFDVILASNIFGDILSDEASIITGSIGMLPSASLGGGSLGLYEPIHGSAPDIAGRGIANPMAAILSAAMMLRYSFSMPEAAQCIENAISSVLNAGYRTKDLDPVSGIGTKEITQHIINAL